MILKRRTRRPLHHTAREFVWPTMGWRRTVLYFKYRILRLRDNPRKIARGVACGVAVCFTPLPFTHFIQAGVFAYLIRGNIFAALLSTWIGTPWTYPPMWFLSYDVGVWTFGQMGWHIPAFPNHFTFSDFWHVFMTDPLPLMLPWLTGGYLVMAGVWFIVYYITKPLIARAQHAHRHRRYLRCHPEGKSL